MSLALARKYRPTTFDDLIGQESISQTLSLALESDRLSHAYLFSGLRGSGKTSTARIFAKALLCEKGITPHPCGKCSHCLMALQGNHMDIIEMDAASNRGIDDIKDLIEQTKYQPSLGRFKVFIIDEVHMLTNQAFNALLKTLEEPPAFVKFILATTDPLKLPATILSRTQHFRFKKIPQPLILQHLEHLLNLEKISYEKEALAILARSSMGSLRDALTLTDQAIVYSKNHIDLPTVTAMLGIIDPIHLLELIEAILEKDTPKILHFITLAQAYEAEMIIDELTLYLKSLLFEKNSPLTPFIIERFFRILADAKTLLGLGSDGEFVLSLALFKMKESLQIQEIDSLIHTLEGELKSIHSHTTPQPEQPTQLQQATTKPEQLSQPTHTTPQTQATQSATLEPSNHPEPPKESNNYQEAFNQLIAKLYDRDYDLGELFEKHVKFISFENHLLTWESTAQEKQKEVLRIHWGLIHMFVKEIFGFETKIKNIAKKVEPTSPIEPEVPTQEEPINEEEMKSSCVAPQAGNTEAAKEKEASHILEEPMVKEAIALLEPKKVRIKRNA